MNTAPHDDSGASVLEPDDAPRPTGGDVESAVVAPADTEEGRKWGRVLLVIAIVLALIAVATTAGLWLVAKKFEGNVSTIEGFEAPPAAAAAGTTAALAPVNILIMGSDNRAAGNSSQAQAEEIIGERSDTTLLVHIAADRKRALAVSIPRDTLLTLPKCASESGQWEVTAKFNSAFTYGGANCTVETVERMTGVQIDHAVVIDFLGFKRVVDALGGVQVCLDEPTIDRNSGLNLPAGSQTVSGDQALAFVRARYNLGDGSDIDRIARQQQFLSSAIRQATDSRLILQPLKLYRVLDAATASLTVDAGLDDLGEMMSMALTMKDLKPADIKFVTMPFFYSTDGADVEVNKPVAQEIWTAIAQDQEWPKPVDPAAPAALTVAPSGISVLVSNGNGQDNAATNAAADLRNVGFGIAGLAIADAPTYTDSVVAYHPADAEAARTLTAAVPGSVLLADPTIPAGQLKLIVGSSYQTTQQVLVPRTPVGTTDDPLPVTADISVCAA